MNADTTPTARPAAEITPAEVLAAYTNAVAIVADADTAHMTAAEIANMIEYTAAGIADRMRTARTAR